MTSDAQDGQYPCTSVRDDLAALHAMLKCAARQSCAKCVACSERALVLLQEAIGKGAAPSPRPVSDRRG